MSIQTLQKAPFDVPVDKCHASLAFTTHHDRHAYILSFLAPGMCMLFCVSGAGVIEEFALAAVDGTPLAVAGHSFFCFPVSNEPATTLSSCQRRPVTSIHDESGFANATEVPLMRVSSGIVGVDKEREAKISMGP
uniref:Cupin type-1 domain-containing protein n=1 Tax=Panagrellus redivivus TaxID=6233 RepID=A0A7E4W580_PANRE